MTAVKRVSRPWTRNGRPSCRSGCSQRCSPPPRSAAVRLVDIRSRQKEGLHIFTQNVGPSALKPGLLKNYGWNGSEIVAFRHHIPSKIVFHNSRSLDDSQPLQLLRGNILAWEQHLADRLDGRPVSIEEDGEQVHSLSHLWLFGGAFVSRRDPARAGGLVVHAPGRGQRRPLLGF